MNKFVRIAKYAWHGAKDFPRLLVPSVLGLLICVVCLSGATLAWCSVNVQIRPQSLTAANFDISVSVQTKGGAVVPEGENGVYSLSSGTEYKITLTVGGTASLTSGYCIMQTGDAKYHTVPLRAGDSLSFTLIPAEDAAYLFTPVWGSYSGTAEISAGTTIGETIVPADPGITTVPEQEENKQPDQQENDPEPENVYIVQQGETLEYIAGKHGLTAEELAAYNNIDADAQLQAGQEIRIPDATDGTEDVSSGETDEISENAEEEEALEGTEDAAFL